MNKILRYIVLLTFACFVGRGYVQELKSEIFSFPNLDYPGLEKVKTLHQGGRNEGTAKILLDYYRARTNVRTPDINPKEITIGKEEQQWADDGLEHTFFIHKGCQSSYNYGEDINWQYWPAKDNELYWQLHRHKWLTPMGRAYRISDDEKYAKEWAYQYIDWIKKNPLVRMDEKEYELVNNSRIKGEVENAHLAWCPLEVNNRLQDQTTQFRLFFPSPSFIPDFLTEFPVNYHKHAVHILANYSDQGSYLLLEAQCAIYTGAFFSESKGALTWRKSGIDILSREVNTQVYSDGGQFEFDPHYHLAAISIFCKALSITDVNGFHNEFLQEYLDTIEKMIIFYVNISLPDYTNPCFSDTRITEKKEMLKSCREWSKLFPKNETIKYSATDSREDALPDYMSKGFLRSGFFVFCNSWGTDATQMIIKANPKGFWHCQPDSDAFEMWFNGKNPFSNSGLYVYVGKDEMME